MALNESLRVDFGETATQALSIERHQETNASGFIAPSFATLGAPFVYLRLYPAVLAKLRATVGTVEQEGVRTADIPGEAVMFRGSDVAQTQHPVHSGLTLDWEGLTFDADGNPLSVSVTADSIGQLRASEPFWARPS